MPLSKRSSWKAFSRMIAKAVSSALYALWRSIRTAPRSAVISACRSIMRFANSSSTGPRYRQRLYPASRVEVSHLPWLKTGFGSSHRCLSQTLLARACRNEEGRASLQALDECLAEDKTAVTPWHEEHLRLAVEAACVMRHENSAGL